MPFNPQATYIGGQLIGQGIQSAGASIGDALKQYEEDKAKVGMADMVMDYAKTQPGAISPEALQRYHQANAKEKAFIAMGAQSNLASMFAQQQRESQQRENVAHANYYIAQAQKDMATAATGPGGTAPKGRIWSDELGGWATPAQADAAKRRSTAGSIMQSYGLTPEQIFDSKQHEAGTVAVDPTTGAKKFTNDPNGDQIRIGGPSGVMMPKAEHEVYKRQLQQSLGVTNMGAVAPGGVAAPAAPTAVGAGMVRVRSPQGQVGTIPANRLEAAQNAGYTAL